MLDNMGFNELKQKQLAFFFIHQQMMRRMKNMFQSNENFTLKQQSHIKQLLCEYHNGRPECVLNGISDIWFDENFQCAS